MDQKQDNLNTSDNNQLQNSYNINQQAEPFNQQQTEFVNSNEGAINSKQPRKTNLYLIIIAIVVLCAIIAFIIKFTNTTSDNSLTKNLKVSLEENKLVCKDENVCNQLKDSIISIKNINTKYNTEKIISIILDKNGHIYLKTHDDIIKIKGTTKLTDIIYAVEVAYAPNDIIVYDNSNMYYISGEDDTVRKFELSKNIKYLIDFNGDSSLNAIDKNGKGLIYYRCDNYNDDSCTTKNDWFYKETLFVKNAKYAGCGTILMNDKLYSDSIITGQGLLEDSTNGIENCLIMNNVDKVWAWDNLSINRQIIALTKDSELYYITDQTHKSYNLNVKKKIKNIYFIDGGSNGKAVLVTKDNIYTVISDYDQNNDYNIYYKTKKISSIKSYINNIRGFYSEDGKLYVLLNNGNTYLVKDFSDKE